MLPLWRRGIRHHPARVIFTGRGHSRGCAALGSKEPPLAIQEAASRATDALGRCGRVSGTWVNLRRVAQNGGPMPLRIQKSWSEWCDRGSYAKYAEGFR